MLDGDYEAQRAEEIWAAAYKEDEERSHRDPWASNHDIDVKRRFMAKLQQEARNEE